LTRAEFVHTNSFRGNGTMTENGKQAYFTRQATGLVRQIGAFDSFVYNQSYINVGMILLYAFLFGAALYPAGSLWLAIALGALIAVPTALVHGMLAAAFPRSGGEYVYNSRILSPAWGFASNWNITLWLFFYMGVGCNWFSVYGLSPLFRFLGTRTDSTSLLQLSGWVAGKHGAFIIGTLTLVIVTALYCRKMMLAVRLQRAWFILGVIGLLIIVAALTFTSKADYTSAYNGYYEKVMGVPDGYSATLAKAKELGFVAGGFALLATFIALYWPANFFFWGNASTYLGGEVRHASKTQLYSMPAAVIFSCLLAIVALAAFGKTVGKELIGAVGYTALISPLDSPGFIYSELGAIACGTFFGTIALIGCAYWAVAFVFSVLGAMTRNLLAWSLDRVMPDGLSAVHDRFHTPIAAIVIGAIACEVGLFLFTYVPAFAVMVGIFGAYLTFMTTSISAALFPFRKKDLFDLSPVNWRIGGFPVITLVGLLSFLGLLVLDLSVFSDPYSGVSINPATDAGTGAGVPFRMFWINLGVFLSGFAVYFAAKSIRKAQGTDISLAFKEIPPE